MGEKALGYSRRSQKGSSKLKRGGSNVMGISATGYTDMGKLHNPPSQRVHSPPQFKGRSKLANGITTRLLRFGTDNDKEERRKLLEEEKVLQLRAALLLSISRKPEKIDVERLKEEIRKLDNPPAENEEGVGIVGMEESPGKGTKKLHHYELETLESKTTHTVTTERLVEVQQLHDDEYSPVHSHNMAGVRPFRAPNPFTDHVAQVADKRIEAAKTSDHGNHFKKFGDSTVAVISPKKSTLHHEGEPTKEEAKVMSVALGDVKKGLAGLKMTTAKPPSPFKPADIKAGLAGLKKVGASKQGGGTSNKATAAAEDAKMIERKQAWEAFSTELRSSLGSDSISISLQRKADDGNRVKKLGDGKFGTAYLYRFPSQGKSLALLDGDVVLKIASFGDNDPNKSSQKVVRQAGTSDEARKLAPAALLAEFSREVKCLVALQHPNIMKFKGVLLPPAPLSLVTEYVAGGSLGQALADASAWKRVSTKQRMGVLKGILRGLNFMHGQNFIHRDVKPHNILLAPSSSSDTQAGDDPVKQWVVAKIADFGTSVALPPGEKCTGEVGTTGYMAPEIVHPHGYNGAVDIFAFGVIGWEMFNDPSKGMRNPMIGVDPSDLFDGPRPECNQSHPSGVLVMAKRAWQGDPSKRPSFRAISTLFGNEEYL